LRRVPVISLAQAALPGFFDPAGLPSGTGWDELLFPEIDDPHAYAVEINGDAFAPVFRDGDSIIVSPAAGLRRGDRVIVKALAGEVLTRQRGRRGAKKLELSALAPTAAQAGAPADQILAVENFAFVHRIVWASQ